MSLQSYKLYNIYILLFTFLFFPPWYVYFSFIVI